MIARRFSLALNGLKAPSRIISPCSAGGRNFPTLFATPTQTTSTDNKNDNVNYTINAFDHIDDDLRHSLSTELRIVEPNEVQNESLPLALGGEDIFVIAQTGSGKTLTFLLPILHQLSNHNNSSSSSSPSSSREAKAIVIGPTAELLEQHAAIATKLSPSLVDRIMFKTPKQLLSDLSNNNNKLLNSISAQEIQVIAIDEVDAVLCGSEFNESIPEISTELLQQLPDGAQYILTTAHLTRAHAKALQKLFPNIATVRQQGGTNQRVLVPTLRQAFHYFSGDISAKLEKLEEILQKAQKNNLLAGHSAVIFCEDEEEVEVVHSFLERSAAIRKIYRAPRKLHTKLSPKERSAALLDFRTSRSDCSLLVTHEIAARGLDCPSVRHVILFDTPTDVTAFVHRAGRTARAGEEGMVTCLVQAGGGLGSFGSGSFGRLKNLHALQDAPKLSFKKTSSDDSP